MKTERKQIFETNSSSTHSITITNIKDIITDTIRHSLREGNVLFPDYLVEYSHSIDLGYDSLNSLTCNTIDTKACLLYQWLKFIKEEEGEEVETYIDKLSSTLGVVFESSDKYSNYGPWAENTSYSLEDFDYLLECVLNPDIHITDSNIPY